MGARTDTRRRMVTAAALLLRERGVAGTTVAAVLEHSGSPRGSVGFHFPGGRSQLLVEALTWVGASVSEQFSSSVDAGVEPEALFRDLCDRYRCQLETTDYVAGCPVWAVAQEAYNDPGLGPVVADVVDDWVHRLARTLVAAGRDEDRARDVAMLCVASLEGAITMCRLTRSTRPIDLALDAMVPHLSTATT